MFVLDDDLDITTIVDQLLICGTTHSMVDQIQTMREDIGEFGTLLYAGHDQQDKNLAISSMKKIAKEVMPEVNTSIGEAD